MSIQVPEQIHGWVVQDSTEVYDRETIFDYIDGAGEVYLSYDFQRVTVHRYQKPDQPEITVELFEMGQSDDAYGVFSYAREQEETGIGQGFEYRGSVLCCWQAHYFICLVAHKKTQETREALFDLAKSITGQMPRQDSIPELVHNLPKDKLNKNTIRFFHTFPILNYHYFLAEQNILKLSPQTNAVLAGYEMDSTVLLGIQYPSLQQTQQGYDTFIKEYIPELEGKNAVQIEDGKWIAVRSFQKYVIIVLDAPSKEYAGQLLEAFHTNLTEEYSDRSDQ